MKKIKRGVNKKYDFGDHILRIRIVEKKKAPDEVRYHSTEKNKFTCIAKIPNNGDKLEEAVRRIPELLKEELGLESESHIRNLKIKHN